MIQGTAQDVSPSAFDGLVIPLADLWSITPIAEAASPKEWVTNLRKVRSGMVALGMDLT